MSDRKDILNSRHSISVQTMVMDAQRKNCWIFDMNNKVWYSPEEFERSYLEVPYIEKFYERFKALDPVEGLKAADIQLQKIIQKKQDLESRVIGYYQKKKG